MSRGSGVGLVGLLLLGPVWAWAAQAPDQTPRPALPVVEQPPQDSVPAVEELPPAYETVFNEALAAVERWYGAGRLPSDWVERVAAARKRLAAVISDRGLLELLGPVLNAIAAPRPILLPPESGRFRPGIAVGSAADRTRILQVDPTSHAWRLGIRRGDELLGDAPPLVGAAGSRIELRLRTREGLVRQLKVERDRADGRSWFPELYSDPAGATGLRPAEGGPESLSQLLSALVPESGLELDLRASNGDPAGLAVVAGWLGIQPERTLQIQAWDWLRSADQDPERVGMEPQALPWPAAELDESLALALEQHPRLVIAPQRFERRRHGKSRVLVDGSTCGCAEAWARIFQAAGLAVYGSQTCGRPYLDRGQSLSGGWSVLLPIALLGEPGSVEPSAVEPARR